jgi:hypothetical protein
MGHPRIRTDWEAIKTLVVSGVGFKEVADQTGVGWESIRKRAQREGWPYPAAVARKAKEMMASVSKPMVRVDNQSVPSVPEVDSELDLQGIVADSWLERAENHRVLAFNIAHKALKGSKSVPIRGWRDIDTADKMARRAAGLDSTEGTTVNVGLTLVNQRIQSLSVPASALLE